MEFFVAFIHFSLAGKENKSALVVGKLDCGFQRDGIIPGMERNRKELLCNTDVDAGHVARNLC